MLHTPASPRVKPTLWYYRAPSDFWRRLTEPHPELPESEKLQARLLSILLLFCLLVTLISLPADLPMFHWSETEHRNWVLSLVLDLAQTVAFSIAYWLSRGRRYSAAAGLTVFILMWALLNSAVDAPHDPLLLISLVLGVLMSSLLLSLRTTLLVFAITVLELALLGMFLPGLAFASVVAPLYILVVMGLLIIGTAWVKQQHLGQIRRQSQALAAELAERTRTAEALREREIHYRDLNIRLQTLIEAIPDAIHFKDARGAYQLVNSAFIRRGGEPRASVLGKTDADFLPPATAAEFQAQDEAVLRSGQPQSWEHPSTTPAGQEYFETIKAPMYDGAGALLGLVGISRNITDRKHVEQTLRDSEQRFRQLAENIEEVFWLFDPVTERLLYVSPGYERLWGRSPQPVLQDTRIFFDSIYPADRQQLRLIWTRFLDGESSEMEFRIVLPTGQPRWVWNRAFPLLDEQGRVYRIAGLASDITARKDAEEQIRRRADEFAALYEMARAVAAPQDLPLLLHTVVEQACRLLAPSMVALSLYDHERGDMTLVAGLGDQLPPQGTRIRLGQGISGYVAKTREPAVVNDYVAATQAELFEPLPGVTPAARVSVPLLHAGELIGALTVADLNPGRRFTDEDARLLALLAGPAAGAVHHARLFEETRRRAEQLALLYDAGIALNMVLDPQVQLQFLFEAAAKALSAERVGFWRHDPARQQIVFEMGIGYGREAREQLLGAMLSTNSEQGIVPLVARERKSLLLADVFADSRWIPFDLEVRSGLWVPITHNNQVLGVLGVLGTQLNQFTADDERLLALFANQASSALENARLFKELQSALSVTTHLYELSGRILGANSLEDTAGIICQTVRDGFTADAASIQLWSTDGQIEFRHFLGLSATFQSTAEPRPDGITMQTLRSGRPAIQTDPQQFHPALRAEGVQSFIVLPLHGEAGVIGLLFVDYCRPRTFADREVELLSLFANQAAVALERVRSLLETRRRVAELENINHISTAMRAARTIDEMLPILLSETERALNAHGGAIWLYDPNRNELVKATERGVRNIGSALKPGEGIAGHVYATNQPYLVREFKSDPQTSPSALGQIEPGIGGGAVPIRTSERIVGVLVVAVALPRQITPAETRLLTTIAEMAGNAIQRMSLYAETENHVKRLTALHEIDLAITASPDAYLSLNVILDQIMAQLSVDAAIIFLFTSYTGSLDYAAGRGFRSSSVSRARLQLGQGLAGRVIVERKSQRVDNLSGHPELLRESPFLRGEDFVAIQAVLLLAKGQIKGVLEVFFRRPFQPGPEWLDFLETLAGQAAIAIDNAELFANLQRSNVNLALAYETTIEGWSRALDLRDRETEGHTQRVTEMTVRLARAMQMPDADLVHVRRGALLHDIGKMGIPDQILLKPGPLTDEEWQVMRKHPVYAYDLLLPIVYLRPALDIPYSHHEKWDGSGYPLGLKGEQIPLAARIFAIVDVWDALRSDRPYRKGWPEDRARQYLMEQSGKHFDPQVVETFLKLMAAGWLQAEE